MVTDEGLGGGECRVLVLTGRSLSHLDGGDATGPQVTLPRHRDTEVSYDIDTS